MSPRANVRSLDAVRHFRPAVIRFEDDVAAALTGLRTELNRTLQWLDHDAPAHWQQQIRNGFDQVAEARTQLSRRQMMTVADHRSECIDEKKALARAKQQLEFAQEKLRLCRQWSIKAHRAADEYSSRIGRAEQTMAQGLPRVLSILERIVLALEQYTASERPSRSDSAAFSSTASEPAKELSAAPPAAAESQPAADQDVPSASSETLNETEPVETAPAGAVPPGAESSLEIPVEPSRSPV
jgi:hypothetical protein